jgi:hypothetical protein
MRRQSCSSRRRVGMSVLSAMTVAPEGNPSRF